MPDLTDYDVAPDGHPGLGLALAGMAAVGTGGYALWHGATMQLPGEEADEARRSRRRWLLAGTALVLTGIVVLAWAGSAGTEAT